jgi:thiol-disulfide isomerase/thioredoxin
MAQTKSNDPAHRAQQVTAPSSGSNRGFILVIAALLVVGLAAVAFVVSSGGDSDGEAGAQTAPVEIVGEALPAIPEATSVTDSETDPAYGTVAPTLIGTAFDGSEVVIEPDGSAKAVYFLAHWCPHCQEEVPVVQDLIDSGAVPAGMEVYAVSTAVNSGRGNYPPEDWFEAEGFTSVVVRDDQDSTAMTSFGGTSFPYAIYLDADHQVVARSAGNLDGPTTQQLWELAAAG